MPSVGPPETYRIYFRGQSLQLASGKSGDQVRSHFEHEVLIQLVAEYPRSAPHMRWLTPIFHPNISAAGAVCLGGWGTHWAPSLQLDRLCEMLWDMLRFANYDTRSPFNQQAAVWLRNQREFRFPLDPRDLRDRPLIDATLAPAEDSDEQSYAQAELIDDTELSQAVANLRTDSMRFEPTVLHWPRSPSDAPNHPEAINSDQTHEATPTTTSQPTTSQPDILFLD